MELITISPIQFKWSGPRTCVCVLCAVWWVVVIHRKRNSWRAQVEMSTLSKCREVLYVGQLQRNNGKLTEHNLWLCFALLFCGFLILLAQFGLWALRLKAEAIGRHTVDVERWINWRCNRDNNSIISFIASQAGACAIRQRHLAIRFSCAQTITCCDG